MECRCGINSWKLNYDSEYHIFICTCNSCGYVTTIYEDLDQYLEMEE